MPAVTSAVRAMPKSMTRVVPEHPGGAERRHPPGRQDVLGEAPPQGMIPGEVGVRC